MLKETHARVHTRTHTHTHTLVIVLDQATPELRVSSAVTVTFPCFFPRENGLICIYPLNGLEHTEVFGKGFFFVTLSL